MKKIGLFGAGHLGKIHAKCMKESEIISLVGVYDVDYERALRVAEEFGTTAYRNPQELLDVCEIADIVTTTSAHYETAKMAMQSGKHVFIEKPVTVTPEEAQDLLEIQKNNGVKVQVGHVERFNPAFQAAQKIIRTPLFIEAHRLALFNPRGNDVSVVLDLMIHDLDIVLKIVNSPLVDIQASGVAIVTDSFDIANVRLHFASGCVANLTASRISLKNMRKTRIFQDNAYIGVDFLDKKCEVIHIENAPDETENPFAMILDTGVGKPKKQIKIDSPNIVMNNAIQSELESFVHAVEQDLIPEVTLSDGMKVLQVAYAVLEKINKSIPTVK